MKRIVLLITCLAYIYNTYFPTYFGCIVLTDSSFDNNFIVLLSIEKRETQFSPSSIQANQNLYCL